MSEHEDVLTIESPFPNNVDVFDSTDPASFPDMDVMIPGREAPLHLHRCVLSRASEVFQKLFRCKVNVHGRFGVEARKLSDFFEAIDGEQAVQWLRFCYGAPIRVSHDNVAALFVMLPRLQLRGGNEIQKKLEDYLISSTKKDCMVGCAMLGRCYHFRMLESEQFGGISKTIAQIVLTQENIVAHRELFVDTLLMRLPFVFLDLVEYGPLHTENSEFTIRKQYATFNAKTLTLETKCTIMSKCDWTELNSSELKELLKLGVINKEKFAELCLERLEKCEAYIERLKAQGCKEFLLLAF